MDAHTAAEMIYRSIELAARSEKDPVNLAILADAVANLYYGPQGRSSEMDIPSLIGTKESA